MKKSISVFLALLLLAFCAVPAFAAGEGVAALKINPYGGDEADIDTVKWFASSGKYFLFLPANTDLSAAKVYFTASDDVTLSGTAVPVRGRIRFLTAKQKRHRVVLCRKESPAPFIEKIRFL